MERRAYANFTLNVNLTGVFLHNPVRHSEPESGPLCPPSCGLVLVVKKGS